MCRLPWFWQPSSSSTRRPRGRARRRAARRARTCPRRPCRCPRTMASVVRVASAAADGPGAMRRAAAKAGGLVRHRASAWSLATRPAVAVTAAPPRPRPRRSAGTSCPSAAQRIGQPCSDASVEEVASSGHSSSLVGSRWVTPSGRWSLDAGGARSARLQSGRQHEVDLVAAGSSRSWRAGRDAGRRAPARRRGRPCRPARPRSAPSRRSARFSSSRLVDDLERQARELGVDARLLDRADAVGVEAEQADRPPAEHLGVVGQLGDGRGLAGAGRADERDDERPRAGAARAAGRAAGAMPVTAGAGAGRTPRGARRRRVGRLAGDELEAGGAAGAERAARRARRRPRRGPPGPARAAWTSRVR